MRTITLSFHDDDFKIIEACAREAGTTPEQWVKVVADDTALETFRGMNRRRDANRHDEEIIANIRSVADAMMAPFRPAA